MKKKAPLSKASAGKKTSLNWKNRREMINRSIALEVDLENRKLFFQSDIQESLHFDFGTNNIDHVIETYLDPNDLKQVNLSLIEAKKGLEKPIPFNFTHPLTAKTFQFEYR